MKNKTKAFRAIISGCIAWMQWGLHPEEVASAVQAAGSLFRAGPGAIEKYFREPQTTIGTDSEVCP